MMIPRTLESIILNASTQFSILLLTGARQIGKTTLLQSCLKGMNYITLDDLDARDLAKNDPALFLQRYKAPLIIDEVQYAPELFPYLKMMVDKSKEKGQFFLTGSQKFHLMKNITESLAGRVAIIDMLGLSQAEIDNRAECKLFIPTDSWLEEARNSHKKNSKKKELMDVYHNIWQGSFPALWQEGQVANREMFYNSYLQTYIQRDVKDLTKVGNELTFKNFLKAVAARTGQLLNYADLARDVAIDQKTAKAWISILEASGIVYLLQPYHSNLTKRLVKAPKLYMLDTGLCAYLTNWLTAETLEAGAMSGAILETYIISEILKSYWHNGRQAPLYFYRDTDQREVDLLIEQDGKLHPIEFKKTATPSLNASRHFTALNKFGKEIGKGAILCFKMEDIPLNENITAIPISYL